jgi:nucleoid DNA-binding protein
MKPTRVKDVISPIAHKHGLSKELSEKILQSYWGYVREKMSSIEHPRIMLPNLGTFTAKPWSVDRKVKDVSKYLDYLLPLSGSTTSYAIMKDREKDLENLLLLQEKLTEESYQKKVFKETKKL